METMRRLDNGESVCISKRDIGEVVEIASALDHLRKQSLRLESNWDQTGNRLTVRKC